MKRKRKTEVSVPVEKRAKPRAARSIFRRCACRSNMKWHERFLRFCWLLLVRIVTTPVLPTLLLAVALPFIIYGAQCSWQYTENRVEDWVPQQLDETKKLEFFVDIFGGDEILMVAWDGCDIGAPELDEFKRKLLEPVAVKGGKYVMFDKVLTGTDMYDMLSGEPFEMSDAEVEARMRGLLLSRDGKTTGLLALISEAGSKYRKQAVDRVWECANEIPSLGADKIRVGGSTSDSVSIDKVCRMYLVEMNVLTYLIGFGILLASFRSIRISGLVFWLAFLNQQICLALIHYLGITFDSILMLSVNLIFVLSLSCCIHFVNFYRKALERLPNRLAVYKMLKDELVPVFGSIITTVFGLLSLLSCQLIPIRKFGLVSTLALLISVVVVVVYVSIFLLRFPVKQWRHANRDRHGRQDRDAFVLRFGRGVNRLFFPLVSRYGSFCLMASFILGCIGLYGFSQIQTQVGISKMLNPKTVPIKDYTWLEDTFGPLIPVEVLLTSARTDDDHFSDGLAALKELDDSLKKAFSDSTILSVLNYIGPLPDEEASGARQIVAKRLFKNRIFHFRDQLEGTRYFREIDGKQYWRITVRTYALRDIDYGKFVSGVDQTLRDAIDRLGKSKSGFRFEEYMITGGVPLVHHVQAQLIRDLFASFMTAFLTVAFVLAFIYRSCACGILAVLPSFLPSIVVFGFIGLQGVKVELGTLLTGSASLGIAVDDAIHYIAWFRAGVGQGMTRKEAVSYAYEQCGMAMFQTTAICSFGLLPYAMSLFVPTVYFSIYMSLLLLVGLLGTYIILPSLLVLRSGNLFLQGMEPVRPREGQSALSA